MGAPNTTALRAVKAANSPLSPGYRGEGSSAVVLTASVVLGLAPAMNRLTQRPGAGAKTGMAI